MDSLEKIKELNHIFAKVLDKCPELTYIGNPVLRRKTTEVSLEEGLKIADRLKKILLEYRSITGFGRGLAAPQIGELAAVFVTFVDDNFQTYVNPKIKKFSPGINFYRESCLSCGFLSVDVQRPEAIEIEYTDEQGNIRYQAIDSFIARLCQHEFDHLEGIVNIDKAEPNSIEFATDDPLQQQLRKTNELISTLL